MFTFRYLGHNDLLDKIIGAGEYLHLPPSYNVPNPACSGIKPTFLCPLYKNLLMSGLS